MKYVGIDLHKQTIVLCVVDKERTVLQRKRFACRDVAGIEAYFRDLGAFEFVVEATACYEWLAKLLEPLASKWVLCHPGKMRVIAESTKKSDQWDAQVLAEFLALGMIKAAYRPTARQREHRTLVRHRAKCRQRVSRLKCRLRHVAASYNADRPDLFEADQLEAFGVRTDLTGADRFVWTELRLEYDDAVARHASAAAELKRFAGSGSAAEQKQREIVRSAPGVGEVVAEVVLSELGDVDRFGSLKDATAYAGLVPAKRSSDGKVKELGITKQGSRLLRWAMVEAAWQAVRHSPRWRQSFEGLKRRRGAKRAIVAVARRLLGVLVSMLKSGSPYRWSLAELKEREAKGAERKRVRAAKAALKKTKSPEAAVAAVAAAV
jgi:transposase